jgi:chromosome partitioning protein
MPRREIAFVNRKGGSGKTTTVFNVAGALLERGYSILAIDLDPQGSFSKSLQIPPAGPVTLSSVLLSPSEHFRQLIQTSWIVGLDVIPADADLKAVDLQLAQMGGRELRLRRCLTRYLPIGYDFVLIDCPPALDLLTTNAMVAASDLIVPVDGGCYGMEALNDTMETIEAVRQSLRYDLSILGIVLSNVNPRTTYDQAAADALREQFGPLVFRTVIPNSIRVDEASQRGRPIVFYDPSSLLSAAYRELAREIVERGTSHGHQTGLQGSASTHLVSSKVRMQERSGASAQDRR